MNECSGCKYFKETEVKNNSIKAEYISRKVLENVMAIMAVSGTEKDRHVWARAISLLYDVPNVDVAPVVHGEWEPIINAYRELEGWMCKHCGIETKQKSNYCPNCGAKMNKE